MKDMDHISVELAERMNQLMAERRYLEKESRNARACFTRLLKIGHESRREYEKGMTSISRGARRCFPATVSGIWSAVSQI